MKKIMIIMMMMILFLPFVVAWNYASDSCFIDLENRSIDSDDYMLIDNLMDSSVNGSLWFNIGGCVEEGEGYLNMTCDNKVSKGIFSAINFSNSTVIEFSLEFEDFEDVDEIRGVHGTTSGERGVTDPYTSGNGMLIVGSGTANQKFYTAYDDTGDDNMELEISDVSTVLGAIYNVSIVHDEDGDAKLYVNGTLLRDETNDPPETIYYLVFSDYKSVSTIIRHPVIYELGSCPTVASVSEDTTPPVISVNLPNTTNTNDNPLIFNWTSTDDSGNSTCALYNSTTWLYSGSLTDGDEYYYEFDTTGTEIEMNFNITCSDNTAGNNTADTILNIGIDTVNPLAAITSPANSSIFNGQTFSLQASGSDENVFMLNVSIINSTGNTVLQYSNNTNDSAASGNMLIVIRYIDTSALADGSYRINATVIDSHTLDSIGDYGHSNTADMLTYQTDEGNSITIRQTTGQIPNGISTSKDTDRYTFDFGSSASEETRTFKVTSQKNIYIIGDSYSGHLVILNGNRGNWIDFVNKKASKIEVKRISPKEVDILVTSKEFQFSSIGGLNVDTIFINFDVDNTIPAIGNESISPLNTTSGYSQYAGADCIETNIASVAFLRNGTLLANDTSRPFNQTIIATEGTFNISTICYDTAGNSGYSEGFITTNGAAPVANPTSSTIGIIAGAGTLLIAIVFLIGVAMWFKDQKLLSGRKQR